MRHWLSLGVPIRLTAFHRPGSINVSPSYQLSASSRKSESQAISRGTECGMVGEMLKPVMLRSPTTKSAY